MRSRAALAAGAAALALLLSGCAGPGELVRDPGPTELEGTESARQAAAFPEVYTQSIDWGGCGPEHSLTDERAERLERDGASPDLFECAWVEAPLDWSDPESIETIELAVVRVPATGEAAPLGPLFGNPGGPGESGLDLMYGLSAEPLFAEVAENYDLIGFDPRGIGVSSPLQCEPDLGDEQSDVTEGEQFEAALRACAEQDPLAQSMGTSQVARDMELLRALLEADWFDYFGISYGTVLGATYSTLFPERVGRMVLDSAAGADWASPRGDFDQSIAFAEQLTEMVVGCENAPERASGDACPFDSVDEMLDAEHRLNDEPLTAGARDDAVKVDGGMLRGYLEDALYENAEDRAAALDTVARALDGDTEAATDILEGPGGDADPGPDADPDPDPEQEEVEDADAETSGSNIGLSGEIVSCHSAPVGPDRDELRRHVDATEIPEVLGGDDEREMLVKAYSAPRCGEVSWRGGEPEAFSGSPDAPILVIGVTGDHATPYAESERLVDELGNAVLLTLEASAHAAAYLGRSACIDDAVTAFLLEGELPAPGTVCELD